MPKLRETSSSSSSVLSPLTRNHSRQRFTALFLSVLVCGGLLPVTLGYLDRETASLASASINSDEESLASLSSDIAARVEEEKNGVVEEEAATLQQLPHSFRHQEHYSHRIEQAVNDFKRSQMKPQQHLQNFSQAAPPLSSSSAVYLRHHHRASSSHDSHQQQQHQQQPQSIGSASHHLRHHNRHHEAWENRVFPALRHHQQPSTPPPASAAALTTTTEHSGEVIPTMMRSRSDSNKFNLSSTLHSRLFDREGLYSGGGAGGAGGGVISPSKTKTTRGPKSRYNYGSHSHHDRAFGDDSRFVRGFVSSDLNQKRHSSSSSSPSSSSSARRFSLKLGDSLSYDSDELNNSADDDDDDDDGDEEDDDEDNDDDDYSYEDGSDEEDIATPALRWKSKKSPTRDYIRQKLDNDNDSEDLLNDNDDYHDEANGFSKDKWNRIEEEHQLKHKQHQRDLQTLLQHQQLRSSHLQNSAISKYTAPPQPARGAIATKRHINNDDVEDIYSRYNIPGTLTRHKFQELGTHEAVKQSRKAHNTNHMQNKALANAHVSKIYSEGSCRIPQRRVERIQKDPSKMYVPHCTVLHRCADDTGCCMTDRQTCAPKRTQSVDLYFFVKSLNSKQGSIERHTFINHTECHCVDTSKHRHGEFAGIAGVGGHGPPAQLMRKATVLNCKCPKLYEKILQEDGYCRCDCSSGNTGCDFLKRGMEHFSMVDRKCILEGRCKPPTCEFGNYIKKHGRCPRREEQLAAGLAASSSSQRRYH